MTTDAAGMRVRIQSRGEGTVAYVTIDNAAKLNVLGGRLTAELAREIAGLHRRADLRAVVLTGAGDKAFIGGGDITEVGMLDSGGSGEIITHLSRAGAPLRRL